MTFVISLILIFVYLGFRIVANTKETFSKAIAFGLVLNFSFAFLVNIGVVMGLLPTKGLSFNFLSYGGSSLVTSCWAIGLLVCIERYNLQNKMKMKSSVFF